MFYGREKELRDLNTRYERGNFECAVFYGRRRVGKTTLIKEFCKNKKAIYFMAREASGDLNLRNFSIDVFSIVSKDNAGNTYFNTWENAFEYIYNIAKDERIILVIDEFPYLAESYRPISSILQAHIDLNLKDSKLFLILCGSSMSFMEHQVLGYQSPLYGRRTCQYKIKPFNFFDSALFLDGFNKEEQAILYGITGGIPEYLSKISSKQTFRENIEALFLTDSGYLFEEPTNLLKQELREPSTYNGIIEAIAKGASKLNEIATKNNIESNKCAKYLNSLIMLGIIKKEIPLTETVSKKSIYLLQDQMFRFWYCFVFPNMSSIVAGFGSRIYEKNILPQLSHFMGLTFEQICKEYLYHEMAKENCPVFFGNLGRWWGNNSKLKRQEEIDIMGFDGDNALYCECKWTNEPVGIDVLDDLIEQSMMFHYPNKYFYLFAKTSFTEQCIKKAKELGNVTLVCFDEMIY